MTKAEIKSSGRIPLTTTDGRELPIPDLYGPSLWPGGRFSSGSPQRLPDETFYATGEVPSAGVDPDTAANTVCGETALSESRRFRWIKS